MTDPPGEQDTYPTPDPTPADGLVRVSQDPETGRFLPGSGWTSEQAQEAAQRAARARARNREKQEDLAREAGFPTFASVPASLKVVCAKAARGNVTALREFRAETQAAAQRRDVPGLPALMDACTPEIRARLREIVAEAGPGSEWEEHVRRVALRNKGVLSD